MIDLILSVDKETGDIKEKLENVSYEEILSHIKKITKDKDGSLFIDFEEYE